MAKNYYFILGVGSDATEDEIKAAYRREAKKCHPDCSEEEDGASFRALREAYEVLADPRRRRAYDRELAREQNRSRGPQRAMDSDPLGRGRPPVEPLVPRERPGEVYSDSSLFSLIQEMFAPWENRPAREIHVDVRLTRRQALHGGRIRVWVPMQVACPACRGRGGSAFFHCRLCRGSGSVVDEVPVEVTFPGGLPDGSQGRVPLRRSGTSDLALVLHFQVGT